MEEDAAWEMLSAAELVLTARGKSIKEWRPGLDLKEEILADVMGRSGNLRAPTIRVGNVFLVGFNEAMYLDYLGGA